MTMVHTAAYGTGQIVASETSRGRTHYKVAFGPGTQVWLDEAEVNLRTASGEPEFYEGQQVSDAPAAEGRPEFTRHQEHWEQPHGLHVQAADEQLFTYAPEMEAYAHAGHGIPGIPERSPAGRGYYGDVLGANPRDRSRNHTYSESRDRGWDEHGQQDLQDYGHGNPSDNGDEWGIDYNGDESRHRPDWIASTQHEGFGSSSFAHEPAGELIDYENPPTYPYDPTPQYPVDMFRQEQTISPDHEIDLKKRMHPTKAITLEDADELIYPGPNPDLFAKSAGWQHDPEGTGYGEKANRPHDGGGRPYGLEPDPDAWEDEEVPGSQGMFGPQIGRSPVDHARGHQGRRFQAAYVDGADHFNDPVQRFRDNPRGEIMRLGGFDIGSGLDYETGEEMRLVQADKKYRLAAWRDVAAKAKRLRNEGAVDVQDIGYDRIYAKVRGDDGVYDTMIAKGGDYGQVGQGISNWRCSCKWGQWAFKRQMTFVGRLCSHGYAAYLEMQSRHIKDDSAHPFNKRRQKLSAVESAGPEHGDGVAAFKKWIDDENGGHLDLDAADRFISTSDDPMDKDEAQKIYDYALGNVSERPERDYDQDDYNLDNEKAYKTSADDKNLVLRTQPHKLTPDLTVVPAHEGDDAHYFTDLGDDRKTTGPDQIMAMRHLGGGDDGPSMIHLDPAGGMPTGHPIAQTCPLCDQSGASSGLQAAGSVRTKGAKEPGHHPAFAWHDDDQDDFPESGIVHFSRVFTADDDLLNKLRNLSEKPQSQDFGNMEDRNLEISETVKELRDRGYDADQLVAFVRRAQRRTATPEEDQDQRQGQPANPSTLADVLNPAMDHPSATTGPPSATPMTINPGGGSGFVPTSGGGGGGPVGDPTGGVMSGPLGGGVPNTSGSVPAPGEPGLGGGPGAQAERRGEPTGGPGAPAPGSPGAPGGPAGPGGGGGWTQHDIAPGSIGPGDYKVQQGDTLSGISKGMGADLGELEKGNASPMASGTNIGQNPDLIHPGDVIKRPGGGDTANTLAGDDNGPHGAPPGSPVTGQGAAPGPAPTPAGDAPPPPPGAPVGPGAGKAGQPNPGNDMTNPGLTNPAAPKAPSLPPTLPGAPAAPGKTGAQLFAIRYFTADDGLDSPPGDDKDKPRATMPSVPASTGPGADYRPTAPSSSGGAPGPTSTPLKPSAEMPNGAGSPAGPSGTWTQGPNGPVDTSGGKGGANEVAKETQNAAQGPGPASGGGGGPEGPLKGLLGGGGGGSGGIPDIGGLIGQIGSGLDGILPGVGGLASGIGNAVSGLSHLFGANDPRRFAAQYFQGSGAFLGEGGGDWADYPFAGSGPARQDWHTTSESYVDEHEGDNRSPETWHTDNEGDIVKNNDKPPQQRPKQAATFARQYFIGAGGQPQPVNPKFPGIDAPSTAPWPINSGMVPELPPTIGGTGGVQAPTNINARRKPKRGRAVTPHAERAARYQQHYADIAGSGDAGYGGGMMGGGGTLAPPTESAGGLAELPDSGMAFHQGVNKSSRDFWADAYDKGEQGYFNPANRPWQEDDSDQYRQKPGKGKPNPKGGPPQSGPGNPMNEYAPKPEGLDGALEEVAPIIAEAAFDDGSDIVRQFQASQAAASLMSGGIGSDGGAFNDSQIAGAAAAFLKTAGRNFSPAEQRALEDEEHHLGARNLDGLDLSGTHYE